MVIFRSLLLVSAVVVLLVGPAAAFAPGATPPLRMGSRAGTCSMNMVRFHGDSQQNFAGPTARVAPAALASTGHTLLAV